MFSARLMPRDSGMTPLSGLIGRFTLQANACEILKSVEDIFSVDVSAQLRSVILTFFATDNTPSCDC